jgi:hypothetical protein
MRKTSTCAVVAALSFSIFCCSAGALAQNVASGSDAFSSGANCHSFSSSAFSSGYSLSAYKLRNGFARHEVPEVVIASPETPANAALNSILDADDLVRTGCSPITAADSLLNTFWGHARSNSPKGDVFAGFGGRGLEYIPGYFYNVGSDKDPFDSGLSKIEPGFFTYEDDRSTLIVGRSFPLESSWSAYFAGKTKSPPVKQEELSALNIEVDWARDSSDAFSSATVGEIGATSGARSRRRARRLPRFFPLPRGGTRVASAYAPSPVSAQSAKPGVLEEPRWAVGSPLRVYISGVVSEARDGLVATEIVSALREWRNASNGKIRFVLTERYVDADILFVCENTVEHQWAENITSYHNSMFDRVRVRLLEETLYKLAPRRVRAVCLHEVGHAFGIRAITATQCHWLRPMICTRCYR